MRCRNVEKWIILELAGELGVRETAALERHLEGCRSCRELRSEYRQLRTGLAEVEPVPVPFISRAWKVRAEGRLPRPGFLRPRVLASSLAMVMILAVVGFVYLGQPDSPLWNESVLAGLEGSAPVTTGTIRINDSEPVPAVVGTARKGIFVPAGFLPPTSSR